MNKTNRLLEFPLVAAFGAFLGLIGINYILQFVYEMVFNLLESASFPMPNPHLLEIQLLILFIAAFLVYYFLDIRLFLKKKPKLYRLYFFVCFLAILFFALYHSL